MIETIITIALSIFLEGIFFLILGVIASSIIEVFVSEEAIQKILPKNQFAGIFTASFLGLIFPVCECAIVPVVHKLLKKGVPLHICLTLLFSTPIVNVLVITSTYFAFNDHLYILFMRMAGGIIISFLIGVISYLTIKPEKSIFRGDYENVSCSCGCASHNRKSFGSVVKHSVDEFFDTGKFFITGIIITGIIQGLVPGEYMASAGRHFPISNIFMTIYPFILSICSNTDAFIARAFFLRFNISAVVTFLVFGAMFDIKTFLMLKKIFTVKFILRLLLLVFTLNILYSAVIEAAAGRFF